MKIALIAHVRHPVAPPFMGGMEAHSWHLAHALVAKGHDVTLFAAGDSDPALNVHPTLTEHYDLRYPWNDYVETRVLHDYLDRAFEDALAAVRGGGFDVVHNNSLHRYPPRMAQACRMPMLTSLHIPPFDALHRAVRESAAPWSRFTVTSRKQLECWWPEGPPPETHVVHNGIDLARWPFSARGNGSAVWAGRITRNKGTHVAAATAAQMGLPLTIFGMIEDRAYFDAEVAPFLGADIRYGGHLDPAGLAVEFGRASVLLFTPLWDEPFGLTAIEAMACGLPIAAINMGAVREVIGEAGAFAPEDPAALRQAVESALAIPREVARARVERNFTLAGMVTAYEALYRQVISGRTLPADTVSFPEIELPERLQANG